MGREGGCVEAGGCAPTGSLSGDRRVLITGPGSLISPARAGPRQPPYFTITCPRVFSGETNLRAPPFPQKPSPLAMPQGDGAAAPPGSYVLSMSRRLPPLPAPLSLPGRRSGFCSSEVQPSLPGAFFFYFKTHPKRLCHVRLPGSVSSKHFSAGVRKAHIVTYPGVKNRAGDELTVCRADMMS
ncbi:hypothetical protein NDU88_009006 [Pleurodeles waltl]|uniref:Uncharacterized protein n=1 Tax=Pleurodeles waltl TaxID=8319 RepID=A0AAV7RUW1_PLEWA|nr:hypothetical protein NDU88_009006 [Pleurodeles waltl]